MQGVFLTEASRTRGVPDRGTCLKDRCFGRQGEGGLLESVHDRVLSLKYKEIFL